MALAADLSFQLPLVSSTSPHVVPESKILGRVQVWQVADSAKILTGGVNGFSSPDSARRSLALLRDIKKFQQAIEADIVLAYFPKIVGNHSLLRVLDFSASPLSAANARHLGLYSCVVPGGRAAVQAARYRREMPRGGAFFLSPSLSSYTTRVVPAFFPPTTRMRMSFATSHPIAPTLFRAFHFLPLFHTNTSPDFQFPLRTDHNIPETLAAARARRASDSEALSVGTETD
ncbi:hypothetical protein B0H13DRAFT_2313175 [Mycena leptocephala]|nr:hypothetical protein B0H13DRAFT_2313175 [Mycena leptocephala]